MLAQLEEFRVRLDDIIIKAFGKRVILWGYDYSGRFLAWYAEYYHSIKPDYIITEDWSGRIPYEYPLFRSSVFNFGYHDIKDAIVWLTIPETPEIKEQLENAGYIKNETYFDITWVIYQGDSEVSFSGGETTDVFNKTKIGQRSIQFMEWLEYQYDCNFVTAIDSSNFGEDVPQGAHSYRISTQKEIFPILDKCHCLPTPEDGIFDFGCGKGGAMTVFLDYGFKKVGGVEFENHIYEIMTSNFNKLGIPYNNGNDVTCIHGDASEVREELDGYNWFYYFDPFGQEVFEKTIQNIIESLKRKPRKIHIININPTYHQMILDTGYFNLTNQFCVAVRQKVVDVFCTKREFELKRMVDLNGGIRNNEL